MKNITKLLGKFNVATLAIFTVVYIGCVVLILMAVSPKYSYTIEPNYEHDIEYYELSNTYQIIYRRTLYNGEVEESYATRTALSSRMSAEDKSDANLSIIFYQGEFLQEDGQEYYYNEVTNTTTSWARTSSFGEGHKPVSFYGKVKYIDKENNTKVKTFKEKMLEAPASIKEYNGGNKITIDDVTFTYQVICTKNDKDYDVNMKMVSTTSNPFHIDIQTWLEDENGNLLPFVGMYGHNKNAWSVSNEKVISQLRAIRIVCEAIIYYDGETYEINYKEKLENLNQSYSEFEDIEVTKEVVKENNVNKIIAFISLGCFVAVVGAVIIIGVVRAKKCKNSSKETAIQETAN